jgi:HEPN domain-containing protein
MQPTTPRDFLHVALQRLTAAEEFMQKTKWTLEVQYIAGYSVECSLKALILEKTNEQDRVELLEKITRGARWHQYETLRELLQQRGIVIPLHLGKRMRRFDWTPSLRYETGRKSTGQTNGLLRTAKSIYDWAEAQIT